MFKADKTLVTELNVTEVTARTKTRAMRQAANTSVRGTEYVSSHSVMVTKDRPFVIERPITSYLAVSAPMPLKMRLESLPLLDISPQHVLHVSPECLPNGRIDIQIQDSEIDQDIELTMILSGGQTHTFNVPAPEHKYSIYPADFGVDAGQSLLFQYRTAPDSQGLRTPVMASTDVVAVLSTVTGQLLVAPSVRTNTTLDLKVNDSDQTNMVSLTVYNNSTHKYSVPLLTETAPGIFEGQLEIKDGVGNADANTLWAQEGDTLVATYVDQADSQGSRQGISREIIVGAPDSETHAVELEVRGLFALNGGFDGKKVTLYGLDDTEVLVDIIYV